LKKAFGFTRENPAMPAIKASEQRSLGPTRSRHLAKRFAQV
jgi:hypothetical protein